VPQTLQPSNSVHSKAYRGPLDVLFITLARQAQSYVGFQPGFCKVLGHMTFPVPVILHRRVPHCLERNGFKRCQPAHTREIARAQRRSREFSLDGQMVEAPKGQVQGAIAASRQPCSHATTQQICSRSGQEG
jgi:hypothetical protein